MPQRHSRWTPAGRAVWVTERLWELAANLPLKTVAVEQIPEFDQNCWFSPSTMPTCREVAQHARRIWEADLRYPIILSAEGMLMDGGHRIAKAWLAGQAQITAVQFAVDPEPDYLIPHED